VCSPSRYGLLTGRYAWRTRLQAGVLRAYDGPLIDDRTLTLAEMLREKGYYTAAIGKWHLGQRWTRKGDGWDYEARLTDGPLAHGFDSYFGMDVTNYPPYAFLENDHILQQPTETLEKRKVRWIAPGPMAPGWKFEEILPTVTRRAVETIQARAQTKQPFFLYFAMPSPHEPVAPSPEFKGKSGLGDIGDYVMETDWSVGQVLNALDAAGIADQTLVVFTADNGHSGYTQWKLLLAKGHAPSGPYRGHKGDLWEGGHRVPFVVHWPGVTKPGTKTGQLVCLNDLMPTLAAIVGYGLPESAAPDAVSFLQTLRGESEPQRESLVHHDVLGRFAIREGRWKLLVLPPEKSNPLRYELYDLESDVAEQHDVAAAHPEVVRQMTELLERQIRDGRSTPGPALHNDRDVDPKEMPGAYVLSGD
jgi:arylsulfatase A-like enzyme